MRDHTKLRAFELADQLALAMYAATRSFPKEGQFALTSQMRRAAVSCVSNIVEGCARHSESDDLRFLDMADGSVREAEYQASLAHRLGYLSMESYASLRDRCVETSEVLGALIRSLRAEYAAPKA